MKASKATIILTKVVVAALFEEAHNEDLSFVCRFLIKSLIANQSTSTYETNKYIVIPWAYFVLFLQSSPLNVDIWEHIHVPKAVVWVDPNIFAV